MLALLSIAAPSSAGAEVSGTSKVIPYVQNGGTRLCLTNSVDWCMNLTNDTFSSGNPVELWWYNSGTGLGWDFDSRGTVCDGQSSCGGGYWPFVNHNLDNQYYGDTVYRIEKSYNGSYWGCLDSSSATWEPCATGYTYDWVYASGKFVSPYWSDLHGSEYLDSRSPLKNGQIVSIDPGGVSGDWYQWGFYG
jgi:hypothetical protein